MSFFFRIFARYFAYVRIYLKRHIIFLLVSGLSLFARGQVAVDTIPAPVAGEQQDSTEAGSTLIDSRLRNASPAENMQNSMPKTMPTEQATDSFQTAPTGSAGGLEAPVEYVAKDSIVLLGTGIAFLHGEADVKYQNLELTSEYMRVHMDSSMVYARGVLDTTEGEWVGKPVFKDHNDAYESDEMTYNLRTQKGYIRRVVTEQGEGYVIADRTKKTESNAMMMAGGMYTTCDQHEHPHFYLKMTKAKVVPGDYIATGPAYMVVGDVPLPLAIPFGFFPFTQQYSSGFIMPNFGDDSSRGLYLSGIGYYFAINDYIDLQVTGDIYTRGTWAVRAQSKYVKRYKFSGNVNINYRNDVTGEKDMPNYSQAKNFSVQWTHTQDAKANPYSTFSASVNFSTSGYNRSNINAYYNPQLNSENTKSSTISYTQRFPDSPWSLSMTASVSQRTKDSTMSLTLPELSINMSRVYPFKRKKPVGKEKWYEKISLSYSGAGGIAINNVKENQFIHTDFLRDWQTGMKHSIPISASFMLFKYLSVTPSINMTDRMYFQRVDRTWDEQEQQLHNDTTNGFYNVFDFNVGVSLSTKLYAFYIPVKKLFPHGRVDRFRHVITPSISFSYHPDFGKAGWSYYGSYDEPVYSSDIDPATGRRIQKADEAGNPMFVHQTYSRFPNAKYGTVGQGAAAALNFSLGNNLEMKVINKKDTTGKEPYKVVSLIDNLSISGGYNFIADSMNWSNFAVNLRIKIPKVNYTINLSGQFDPYMYELNALGTPVRTNKQYWHNGRFPHFLGTSTSLSYTFNNQTFKKWFNKEKKGSEEDTGEDGEMEDITVGDDGLARNGKLNRGRKETTAEVDDGYVKTEFPWSLSVSYTLRYGQGNEFDYDKMYYKMVFTHNLSLSGSLGFGKGWKVSASTSYDFKAKRFASANFNVSRDLHCWNMTASFVPFGPYKSYTFHIGVNASMLADLKYDKSSTQSTNKRVDWW